MSDQGRWPVGENQIEGMIERGEIEEVEPSAEHANLLMGQADKHLDSAVRLVEDDPPSAFTLLYDAARKAMTAVLAKQGLRPTRAGGHVAVQEAIEAQTGQAAVVVRPFRGLRRRRNETEYPALDDIPVTSDEACDALTDARGIVDTMKKFLPRVVSWR